MIVCYTSALFLNCPNKFIKLAKISRTMPGHHHLWLNSSVKNSTSTWVNLTTSKQLFEFYLSTFLVKHFYLETLSILSFTYYIFMRTISTHINSVFQSGKICLSLIKLMANLCACLFLTLISVCCLSFFKAENFTFTQLTLNSSGEKTQ